MRLGRLLPIEHDLVLPYALNRFSNFLGFQQLDEVTNMRERRKFERFDLRLPGTIEVLTLHGTDIIDFLSNDISMGGSYIHANVTVPEGTHVRLNLTVHSERLAELTGTQGRMTVDGTVVRCTSAGIAVCFGEDCQILPQIKG